MATTRRQSNQTATQLSAQALALAYEQIARAAQQQFARIGEALPGAQQAGTVQLYRQNALFSALAQARAAQADAVSQWQARSGALQQQRTAQIAALRMQAQGEALARAQQQDEAQQRIAAARAQQQQAMAQQAMAAQGSAQDEAEALALENALREVQVFGRVVSARTAQVLGVPVGTLSYASAQAAQKQAKSGSSGRKRSSSSGSRRSGQQGSGQGGRLTAASELTTKYQGGRYS